jgi:hypothetical protein
MRMDPIGLLVTLIVVLILLFILAKIAGVAL